ncbi:MAG: ABC transporter ATP-binding protein [Chloroflexota bacterium]|nr:ABC transporter ATP-binding protein [Chloroflexota bacterium]
MTAVEAPAIISAEHVTRRFGSLTAVRDLTLRVPKGQILGMIGPSGSGKTTTVRMLTGTLPRNEGEISVLGEDPQRFSRQVRERIAYMPQLFSLYPDLTARENVGFVSALFGIGPFRRGKLIRRALEVVELWDARNKLARDLSGGMQRRLELACALVHSPNVLFVDEPTAGVDPILRVAIWTELRRLRDEGRTLLVTTQYVAEAQYCDVVAVLAEGELVAVDQPEALRRSVFRGEMLEVEADRAVDPDLLAAVPQVMEVRQAAARKLLVITENAGLASPRIMEAMSRRGVGVVAIEEYQPTFDEVFAGLVERQAARVKEADDVRPD